MNRLFEGHDSRSCSNKMISRKVKSFYIVPTLGCNEKGLLYKNEYNAEKEPLFTSFAHDMMPISAR